MFCFPNISFSRKTINCRAVQINGVLRPFCLRPVNPCEFKCFMMIMTLRYSSTTSFHGWHVVSYQPSIIYYGGEMYVNFASTSCTINSTKKIYFYPNDIDCYAVIEKWKKEVKILILMTTDCCFNWLGSAIERRCLMCECKVVKAIFHKGNKP